MRVPLVVRQHRGLYCTLFVNPAVAAIVIRRSGAVREGGVEPPRPFGHRILRLLPPGMDPGATCHPVSSDVVPYPSVSSCCEQTVSNASADGLPNAENFRTARLIV
jgi:hypothetical protein